MALFESRRRARVFEGWPTLLTLLALRFRSKPRRFGSEALTSNSLSSSYRVYVQSVNAAGEALPASSVIVKFAPSELQVRRPLPPTLRSTDAKAQAGPWPLPYQLQSTSQADAEWMLARRRRQVTVQRNEALLPPVRPRPPAQERQLALANKSFEREVGYYKVRAERRPSLAAADTQLSCLRADDTGQSDDPSAFPQAMVAEDQPLPTPRFLLGHVDKKQGVRSRLLFTLPLCSP